MLKFFWRCRVGEVGSLMGSSRTFFQNCDVIADLDESQEEKLETFWIFEKFKVFNIFLIFFFRRLSFFRTLRRSILPPTPLRHPLHGRHWECQPRETAVIYGGLIYTSSNFGATWTASRAPSANWHSVSLSLPDGPIKKNGGYRFF